MKKLLIIGIPLFVSMLVCKAQESLLNFAHSRVITENYNNEMSTRNEVIYFNAGDFSSQMIDCRCERQGERKLTVEFEYISEETGKSSIIQLRFDLLLVMDAYLATGSGITGAFETQSITKLNVQLSSFDFDKLDHLHGVARLAMPADSGFIDNEKLVYIRFKCAEGHVSNLTERFPLANASH